MMDTKVYQSTLTLPVTALYAENPLPRFADVADKVFNGDGLTAEEAVGFGQNTGFRVLPYRMQDRYAADPAPTVVPTVVLENALLRATFLPGYGGRLHSLWDKVHQRECLYSNTAITLRNLALRDAWFSGGIEWNFGHYGHTYLTSQDVFFAACVDDAGEPFLRMYEFERCKQVTFQVDFHLPAGAAALTAHISQFNRRDAAAPIFYWTNTAVPQVAGAHVYAGTAQTIATHLHPDPAQTRYCHGTLPCLYRDGQDASDPAQLPFSTEYFFQNPPDAASAFEAVQYPDGRCFAERATGNMPYRKMFCWGTHRGGEHWQRFLAGEGAGDYLEVQAGITRTQAHPAWLVGNAELHITQQITLFDAPPVPGDYETARRTVEQRVAQQLPVDTLLAEHERCARLAVKPVVTILHSGYGWGALEKCRDPHSLPEHLCFPESTLGVQQQPWLNLLNGQPMAECDTFMVAQPWLDLLLGVQAKTPALYQALGVALLENGRQAEAETAWQNALKLAEQPLAHRNLAVLARRRGDMAAAVEHLRATVALATDVDTLRPCAEEYMAALAAAGRHAEAFAYFCTLPQALQAEERLRLTVLRSAFETGQDAFVQAQFAARFSVVREGEAMLSNLWFADRARKLAAETGVPVTQSLLEHVQKTAELPPHLDFRMEEGR